MTSLLTDGPDPCWNINTSSWNWTASLRERGRNRELEPVLLASTKHLKTQTITAQLHPVTRISTDRKPTHYSQWKSISVEPSHQASEWPHNRPQTHAEEHDCKPSQTPPCWWNHPDNRSLTASDTPNHLKTEKDYWRIFRARVKSPETNTDPSWASRRTAELLGQPA